MDADMHAKYREIICNLWRMFESFSNGEMDVVLSQFIWCKESLENLTSAYQQCQMIPVQVELENILDRIPIIESKLKTMEMLSLINGIPIQNLLPVLSNIILSDGDQPLSVTLDFETANPKTTAGNINAPALDVPTEKPEDQHKATRKEAIDATRQDPGTEGLDTVAGLGLAKQLIREAVILPFRHPQLFTGGRRPWTRILLYGPPGTGKTRLANAVAAEVQSAFYQVSGADILSSWVGESEKGLRELFQQVNNSGERAVIFFDEIDGLCRKRTSSEQDHTRRLKTELLSQLEKLGPNVFLLAATNCPWDMDIAFLRRFERRVYIPLPDREARMAIFSARCLGNRLELTNDDWEKVLNESEGYSGSDLMSLTTSALFEPIRDLTETTHWIQQSDGFWKGAPHSCAKARKISYEELPPLAIRERDVELGDFLKAIAETSRTVSREDLEEYDAFNAKYKS